MSVLDLLKAEVNINDIEKIVYNNEFELDKEESFKIMDKMTDLDDLLEGIVFVGKNFVVIMMEYESEYSGYYGDFVRISTKKNKLKKIVPANLTHTYFNKEFGNFIPLTKEYYVEKENKEKKKKEEREKRDALNRKIYKERFHKTINELKGKLEDLDEEKIKLKSFLGGDFGSTRYIFFDGLDLSIDGMSISKKYENLLPISYKYIDFFGYGGLIDGKEKVISSLWNIYNYEKEEYEKLVKERKLYPIIGISSTYVRLVGGGEILLDEVAKEIIKELSKLDGSKIEKFVR